MKAIFHNTTEMLVSFSNDFALGEDGWAQIAPLGDFPGMAFIDDGQGGFKKERAIQRMDKQAVTNMVNEFTQGRRGIRKFFCSRPIFHGHPDMPGGKLKYPDAEPKGVFANVAARDPVPGRPSSGGFYGEPILTPAGEDLVASKKVRAFSGRWEAEDYLGEELIGGRLTKVFRPTRFLSAGLTDRPNLPVEMFNEAEAEQKQTERTEKQNVMNKTVVIALFAAHGILNSKGAAFANDAGDDEVSAGITRLGEKLTTETNRATTLTNEKATLANDKAQLEGRVTALTTEKGAVEIERNNARTSFANERTARIGELLDGATQAGRITGAERATWETRLKNEATFANEAEALKKLTPTVKTTSVTLTRGDRKVEISNASDRREMVTELVNERMASKKEDYDTAFAAVQKTYPTLFEAMEQPALGKRKS